MSRITQLSSTAQDSLIPVAPTVFMTMEPTVKMHAACEECRGRKLRCSGHRPQCDRCKKDQVACTYSPQKRMGRPRKLKSRSAELPERHSTCLGHPYITPEPVPHLRAIDHHQSEEQGLGSEWVQLFSGFETQMHNPNSPVYYHWSTGEGLANNCSLERHTYDFGNIHVPVPVADHLFAPHTQEMHPQHIHVPRLHNPSSPDGSVSFGYSSPEFAGSSHILGHYPPLPPAPPVSRAGGSLATMNLNDTSGHKHTASLRLYL
ncbi:hypothetical protein L211DRAFT_473450 [Terfezia boudieri ATCC MYA-4762]|uniref:Zn(2)-C6 fungal-type domain-containing protein n=1 Tax=Terfezia boudieri ATCC MYA-4762 TaxID=1051890 RepID=A0A3N4LYE1_9PEZI|nr:hypothetical protein L211DRAFT_473450 [Terfezia boudieri ATCC MYA-4762]